MIAGSIKFTINSFKNKNFAFKDIGYAGLPSNHSAIGSATTTLVALKAGISHPAFCIATALSLTVILNANILRRHIGRQAERLNGLKENQNKIPLRETIGHTRLEIGSGIIVGILSAWIADYFFYYRYP